MERVHWQGTVSGDCEGVCVCVVICHSHSHPSPLHVSLFILLSFRHLTKTNDGASEMSSSPAHKQVEGGGGGGSRDEERQTEGEKKALQSRAVPLFSVWLCPLA